MIHATMFLCQANNALSKAMKTTVVQTNIRQMRLRDRAAMLIDVATELRPRLSLAEKHYFNNLKALNTQTRQACMHLDARCRGTSHESLFPELKDCQLELAGELLVGQTKILLVAATMISDIEIYSRELPRDR